MIMIVIIYLIATLLSILFNDYHLLIIIECYLLSEEGL